MKPDTHSQSNDSAAWERFNSLAKRVLTVSKGEIAKPKAKKTKKTGVLPPSS
jgi:hypothetical protein